MDICFFERRAKKVRTTCAGSEKIMEKAEAGSLTEDERNGVEGYV